MQPAPAPVGPSATVVPRLRDAFDVDRLATAHEREAAWCDMQARSLAQRAAGHRLAAVQMRNQLDGVR